MNKRQENRFRCLLHEEQDGAPSDLNILENLPKVPQQVAERKFQALSNAYDKWREKRQSANRS